MNVVFASVIALTLSCGLLLLFQWRQATERSLAHAVSVHAGLNGPESKVVKQLEQFLNRLVAGSPQSPWGSDRVLAGLIVKSGQNRSVPQVRTSQLATVLAALAGVTLWSLLRQLTHHSQSPLLVGLLLVAAIPAGGWAVKSSLETSVRKRAELVNAALPGALELLAFSVSAGEPISAGMKRVAQRGDGTLNEAFQQTITRLDSGTTMSESLKALGRGVDSPQLSRAVHAIDLALERGTPLADVLRAQASDARAAHARDLMILAGKKETAMLLPVVFLILPMIVMVAIYPGLVALKVM